MLSKTRKQTLYSVVVTSKMFSTPVLKNNPILIFSLLWKERKKNNKHRFAQFQYCLCLFTLVIYNILCLSRNVFGANRFETVCWMSTFNPKYSTCVFDLNYFSIPYSLLAEIKYWYPQLFHYNFHSIEFTRTQINFFLYEIVSPRPSYHKSLSIMFFNYLLFFFL